MILYLINNDYIVKITDFNGTSITGMEYAQTSDPSTWYTFTSVALETPSGMDVNNGYGWATHKFVGFGENGTGNNMIFFSDAFGPGSGNSFGSSISFHGLALSGDWGSLYYNTTFTTAELAINLLGVGLAHNYIMDTNMADPVSSHDGTFSGASFSSDVGRNHISFDGVDDFATITDTANLAGEQWTISMWLKTSVTSGRQDFFGQWYDPTHYPSIGLATNDGVLTAYYRGHNTGGIGQLAGSNIANGEWRHISYVKDGTAVKLYVDGSLVASSVFSGTIDSTSDIFLGVWDGSILGHAKDHYFTGGMDNLMIHTRGLSAGEVAELHTSTIVTVPASVTVDQDPSSVSIGDVMTATVDLQGGTLGYFAWEKYNAESSSWAVVAGGSNSVVDMTVDESMSEATMKVSMQVDGQWYFTADMTMPVLDINNGLVAKYALDTDANDSAGSNNLSLIGGTVSFWAKEGTPYTYSGNNYSSFFRWGTHAGSYFDLYLLNGKIRALHNAGNGWVDNRGSVAVSAGWNHYAMTIDPSNGSKIVYLNGVAQTLSGGAFSGTFAASQQVWLGNISTQSGFRLNGGAMDDTRIWNRALSASEIAGLHAAGAEEPPAAPATPIQKNGYYPLYPDESDANGHAGGNGTSHSHEFDGVTYYMSNGLNMDPNNGAVTQWHGDYGLEGQWSFDNGDATADTGVDGSASNVTFETLESRTAATFVGSGGIDIPHSADQGFDGTTTTVSAWFKTTQASQGYAIMKAYGAGDEAWLIAVNEADADANKATFFWRNRAGTTIKLHSTSDMNDGVWHHIVTVRDGENLSLYVDGALEASSTGATGTFDPTQSMRLGKWDHDAHSAGTFYVGSLDDVRIHDRAMDADEVAYWYAETTVVHTPSNDASLTLTTGDTYGDGWNGNVLNIFDANGTLVATSTGPASTTRSESLAIPDDASYTYTIGGGDYLTEVHFYISYTGTSTIVLNVTNAVANAAGSFTLGIPDDPETVEASIDSFQSDSITFSVLMNASGQANAAGWSYRLDDGYVVGQSHGGTVVAMGQPATISVTPGVNTIYVASIDSQANVLAKDSFVQDTIVISLELVKVDSYGDGWNGAAFTMTDVNGTVVVDQTAVLFGETVNVQVPAGTYTYELSAGSYANEVSMSLTNLDSGQVYVNIGTSDPKPATGTFTVTPPQPSVTLTAIAGYEAVYISAIANQVALDEGASHFVLSAADNFGDVGTIVDSSLPLTSLEAAGHLLSSTEDTITGYVALVDSSGEILAKSSVSGQAMINQMAVGQEMVLMAVLAPSFIDDQMTISGVMPSSLRGGNDIDNYSAGPFYMGDLEVSSFGTIAEDWDNSYSTLGLKIPTNFHDGMGGTMSAAGIGRMVKDMIRKLDMHQLSDGDADYGALFQSVLNGSDLDACKVVDWNNSSIMLKHEGGGYSETTRYKLGPAVGGGSWNSDMHDLGMTIPAELLIIDGRTNGYFDDEVDPGAIKGVIAPAESVISGEASVSNGEVTMSVSVGEFAQAQGAVGWVYLLDQSVGDVGQTTSETVNSLGSDAVFTPSPVEYTAYVAAVDASGVIMATDSFGFDARPMRKVRFEVITSDWRGTTDERASLTFTDPESGQSWTSPAVAYSTNSAVASFPVFEIPESIYSWSCVGNATTSDSVHIRLVEVDENENVVRPLVYVWNRSQPLRLQNYVSGLDYQSGWGNSTVYTLHNSSPNVTSGQFVLPADTIAPVMTLIGESPLQVYTGAAFADPGVSVNDNLDPAPVVTVTGHESLAISESWTATSPQNGAPVINGDLLNFDQPNQFDHTVHKATNISSSEDSWEVVVEFDNYSAYNNHSYNWLAFFIARTNGSGYLQLTLGNAGGSGFHAGWQDGNNYKDMVDVPIGLAPSGALKIARENGNFKFYYSLDKVSFTLITQVPDTITTVTGGRFDNEDLRIQLRVKDAAADVTSFKRTDIPYGAQQGEYTLTYSAEDFSGNTETLQRTVSVVPETYEWHHNNQLTDIVKYLHGYDANGARSHMYLKDDDGLTVLYFTPDLETFASFTAYDVDQHFIEGAPVCAAYGPAGQVLLGTETGCLYMIELSSSSVPTSFTKVHDNGGMRINQVHFGVTSNAWLVEYNEQVYTMPAEGGTLSMRMTIPAGSHVIDFAQADDATSIIIRKADYSFATYIAMPGWATIHDESAMRAIFSSLGTTNVDYNYEHDMWTAADSNYNVIMTDKIVDWLLS